MRPLWNLGVLLAIVSPAFAATVNVSQTETNVIVSWTGGSLQSVTTLPGPWLEVLGARSPRAFEPSNDQRFFRTIGRWETRAELLDANSEMGVAEVGGKIYVIGGYPASRITMRTVQVYDPIEDSWELTTPLPVGGLFPGLEVGL